MSKKSRLKKQAIRNIERHLRNYYAYRTGIENLRAKLDMIRTRITTNYEFLEGSFGTFLRSSSVEEIVIDNDETNETIKLYEMIINTIDRAVGQLSEQEQKFVKLRYFEHHQAYLLPGLLDISERQVHRIRYKIMDQLLISMASIKHLRL